MQIAENIVLLWRQSPLIRFLGKSRRESNLRKTLLGKVWLLLEPLGSMLVYYVMLTVIFHAGPRYGVDPFVFIMAGIAHFFLLRSAVASGCQAITSQNSLLLQTRIEPLVFYAVAFRESLLSFLTFLGLFFCILLYMGPMPGAPFLALYPFALVLLLILAWSWGLIAAVVTLFFRDFQRMSGFFLRFLLYGSPVLYSASFVPENLRDLFFCNPLASIFGLIHTALFGHELPKTGFILFAVVFTAASLYSAHALYNGTKRRFTKVL